MRKFNKKHCFYTDKRIIFHFCLLKILIILSFLHKSVEKCDRNSEKELDFDISRIKNMQYDPHNDELIGCSRLVT